MDLTDLAGAYAETPSEDPARIPSTQLLPRDDRTLRPNWMARSARERLGIEPTELPGAHNLYTAQPELVVEAIAEHL